MTSTRIGLAAALGALIFALGCTGADGAQGPAGPQGAQGDPGAAGAAGTQGPAGADGAKGADGTNGKDAVNVGSIVVTATDAVAGDPLAGVAVTVKDSGGNAIGTAVNTDASGKATIPNLPLGTVIVNLTKQYYTASGDISVAVNNTSTGTSIATKLAEASSGAPTVSIAVSGTTTPDDIGYGATATLTATANSPTNGQLTYAWSNGTATGLGAVAQDATNKNVATVTMPTAAQATAARTEGGVATQYVSATPLEDRIGLMKITSDARGAVSAKLTVSDNRGKSTTASVSLNAASVQTGNQNVAVGQRVYVNSGHDGTNAWTMTSTPSGSTAAVDSAANRLVSFVADKAGKYVLTEGGTNSITVYAGDWVGVVTGGSGGPGSEVVSYDDPTGCPMCHDGSTTAPNPFPDWAKTGHAIKFAKGLVGDNGTSWSVTGCGSCHTVGYDLGVTNNGFDDLQKAANWTQPPISATAWQTLASTTDTATKAMLKMTNIQCENCHGPNNSAAHRNAGNTWGPNESYTGEYGDPRISFSAETCGTCHASGTGHHYYSQWKTTDPVTGMGHSANSATMGAIAHAISGSGSSQTLNAHCGRCHSAQGAVQYFDQIASGNPGNLTTTAGVNAGNVEPVTCTACHDPHSNDNPNQLRAFGDTSLLAAGFKVSGAGKGALCMTCHNSRNATYGTGTTTYLHEDGQTVDAGKGVGNPNSYSAPHQACQTDVFAGHNAYFMGVGNLPALSKHAAVEDTCVGCHMANNPSTHLSHGSPATNSHEFRITDANKAQLCSKCHSSSVDGEAIQAQVEDLLATLKANMGNAVKTKLNGMNAVTITAYDATSDKYSAATPFDFTANPITAVDVVEIHGQIGFQFTLTTPVSLAFGTNPASNVSTFGVQMGSIANGSTPIYAYSGNLVRAGWNYFLIEGDQSKGIHNPTFAMNVLNKTIAQDLSF